MTSLRLLLYVYGEENGALIDELVNIEKLPLINISDELVKINGKQSASLQDKYLMDIVGSTK